MWTSILLEAAEKDENVPGLLNRQHQHLPEDGPNLPSGGGVQPAPRGPQVPEE